MLPFNIPPYVPQCSDYVTQVIQNRKICGDGPFTARCNEALEALTGAPKALLTTSGTSALEMAAILLDIQPGDEVIMPSFTFVSTANAFALRGAKIVFVDVQPDTMNLDPLCVRAAITPHTRAIVPVHYAGVCCDMDALGDIAREHGLAMVEDAAQAVGSFYKDRPAGSMSDVGCFSFHETKNYSMGEGGAIVINRPEYNERAEILREKGTNRSKFFRGQVDQYTWVDFGDSYLPSELNAAYLWAQLMKADEINEDRLRTWNEYWKALLPLAQAGKLELPTIPEGCVHNAHMFYIKAKNLEERTALIKHLKERDILAVFHYVPLHSAPAGLKFGRFAGEDVYTTAESDRLLRLPMYFGLTDEDRQAVINAVTEFYDEH